MKAVQVRKNGAPGEVCEVVEIAKPEPGPGQVRVRVAAASLNFNDIDRCRGKVTTVPTPVPFTLGMDVCGTVDAAGAGAEAWVGKRVIAMTQMAQGGLAEYALSPAGSVFDAPPGLDDAEATSFLIPFHTAHLALFERGKLAPGETLLVHSGASSLGTAAIQLGVAKGARVLATAGGPEQDEALRASSAPSSRSTTARRTSSPRCSTTRGRWARTSSAISPAATSSRSRGSAPRARAATSASASPTTPRTASPAARSAPRAPATSRSSA